MAGMPISTEPTPTSQQTRSATLRRDLRLLNADAFAWAVMTGCGEAYFVAFGLAAGLGEVTSGLLATVPLLIGAAVQMVSPWGIRRCGSLRTWIASNAASTANYLYVNVSDSSWTIPRAATGKYLHTTQADICVL